MKRNRLKVILVSLILTVCLTGCDNVNTKDVKGLKELGAAMNTRIDNNIEMLNRYYNSGLIDDNTYANALAHLQSNMNDVNILVKASDTSGTEVSAGSIQSIVDKLVVGFETVNDYVGTFRWSCSHTEGTNPDGTPIIREYSHEIKVRIVSDSNWGQHFDAYDCGTTCPHDGCERRPDLASDRIECCRTYNGTNEIGDQIGDQEPPSGAMLYLQNFILADMSGLPYEYKEMKKFNVKNTFAGNTTTSTDLIPQNIVTDLNHLDGNKSIGLGYEIIDQETKKKINDSMNLEIWVLDPAKLQEASLDELANKLDVFKGIDLNRIEMSNTGEVSQNAINNYDLDTSVDILNYFKPATDDNGNQLYLYQEKLSPSDWTNLQADEYKEWKLAPVHSTTPSGFQNYRSGTITDLGHDLTIRCGGDTSENGWDIIVMRLTEFNYDVYEELKSRGVIGENKYLRMTVDNNGNTDTSTRDVLLLMDYPVSMINKMKETEDGNSVYLTTNKSEIEVNIMTGKITKTSSYTGSDPATVENKDTPYTIIAKAGSVENTIELSTSSYVLKDSIKIKLEDAGYTNADAGAVHSTFETSKIILRDYLEATYMPNLVGSDPFVVYGRKIRFSEFPTKDEPIEKSISLANFVDINGNEVASGKDLFCDDFADITKLAGNNPVVHYIKWQEEKDKEATTGVGEVMSEDLSDAMTQVGKLKYASKDSITLTGKKYTFPGPYIDSADKGNNRLPVFYVIALNTDVTQSGLMSWINDTSETSGYHWWSQWLLNQEYSYQVAGNAIDALFRGSYNYGTATDGYVVLNLETIDRLEREYREQEDSERVSTISTIFIILGWFIIMFGCFLPFLWLIDTSFDFGLNIIEHISFGHWIPVKFSSDIPEMDTEERHYLDFWGILKKSFILIIMGVTLIRVNIIGLIARFVGTFGGPISKISDWILGN